MSIEPSSLARELMTAYAECRTDVAPPTSRDSSFNLRTAYGVQTELASLRRADGHRTVGWTIGYANKALWKALKLETVTWAPLWDDTVRFAPEGVASVSLLDRCSPKIEPQIVIKLKGEIRGSETASILEAAEWLAIGVEIIDCVFADWKFHPADFVAAAGLHAALVVGAPRGVDAREAAALAEQLSQFKIQLRRHDRLVEEGSGKNALRSPVLAAAELSVAMLADGAGGVKAGDLIGTGTLTAAYPIAAGEIWSAAVEGIDLAPLTLRVGP